ncbi:xanthotoxin 5-hydroxylase CYP82C4-like [Aristolochia californica]|uniref:xanthotoxin 5-hydroxylase CYP82C4-like n=1 Tax=Aristolochia californica TaxID=171875 RepID=UPI0035D8FB05
MPASATTILITDSSLLLHCTAATMEPSSTLIFVLSMAIPLVFSWLIYSVTRSRNQRSAPCPPALPIIGNLHLLSGSGLLQVKFAKIADQFGPILQLRAGSRRILLVSDAAVARECFTTHDRAFASRPRTAASQIMGNDFLSFAWAPYGPLWRELRKIATLELFSLRRLQLQAHFRDEETSSIVAAVSRVTPASPVRIKDYLLDMVMRIILRMVGGGRDEGFVKPETTRELLALVETAFYFSGIPVLGDSLPFLKWVDWKGTQKAMREIVTKINALIESWVDERRKMGGAEESLDFMDVVLSMADKEKIDCLKEFTQERKDLVVYSLLEAVVFAAIDTTALSLEWLMAELLNKPDILQKAQEEIDSKVGNERKVEEKDIEELPYLKAIVKETLRLHPAGPLLMPHESTEDCVVSGFHVPAGTQLIVNAWKIHRDPNYWLHPLRFEPERFLGPDGSAADVDMKGQHFEFIPFGSGRRSCPGAALGLSVLHLASARLLHAFEWKVPASSSLMDMSEGAGLTSPKAVPLEALLLPRSPAKLYL